MQGKHPQKEPSSLFSEPLISRTACPGPHTLSALSNEPQPPVLAEVPGPIHDVPRGGTGTCQEEDSCCQAETCSHGWWLSVMRAPQEHARGAQHSGMLLPAPWGGPLGRKMPATGTAVLVCSTGEFSLEYLNPLLGVRGSGSLTNASTLRVKLF